MTRPRTPRETAIDQVIRLLANAEAISRSKRMGMRLVRATIHSLNCAWLERDRQRAKAKGRAT